MNVAVPIETAQPFGVSVVRDADGLGKIHDTTCAAAIWDRQVPPEALAWLAGLEPDELPSGRMVVEVAAVAQTVRHLCDLAGMPDGKHREWLIGDIAALAESFATVMRTAYVRLRLQAVTTNACRKFHLDAITGRLLCTYRGTGTQYGTSADGDDPDTILVVPTGSPAILRGSLWPTHPATGLLHRSPPIEGTGETRLVLVLDPISDPDRDE